MVAGQRSTLDKGKRLFLGCTQWLPLFYPQQFPFLFFNQYLQRQTHAKWIIYENGPWGGLKNRKTKLTLEWKEKEERLSLWLDPLPGHITHTSLYVKRVQPSVSTQQNIYWWSCELFELTLLASITRMSRLKEQHRLRPLTLHPYFPPTHSPAYCFLLLRLPIR